jgi:hypothetical protein
LEQVALPKQQVTPLYFLPSHLQAAEEVNTVNQVAQVVVEAVEAQTLLTVMEVLEIPQQYRHLKVIMVEQTILRVTLQTHQVVVVEEQEQWETAAYSMVAVMEVLAAVLQ